MLAKPRKVTNFPFSFSILISKIVSFEWRKLEVVWEAFEADQVFFLLSTLIYITSSINDYFETISRQLIKIFF